MQLRMKAKDYVYQYQQILAKETSPDKYIQLQAKTDAIKKVLQGLVHEAVGLVVIDIENICNDNVFTDTVISPRLETGLKQAEEKWYAIAKQINKLEGTEMVKLTAFRDVVVFIAPELPKYYKFLRI